MLKKEKINYLLCCENGLTYSNIIDLFLKHSNQTEFLIHAKRCQSIIGSSNKEKKQSAVKQLSGLLKNKISDKVDWKNVKTQYLQTKYGL